MVLRIGAGTGGSGVVADSLRSRQQLLAENAMLRQQVINLRRAVKRPRLTPAERLLLVISSCVTKRWRRALHIVQPDTLLRWHRDLFRLRWRFLSRRSKKRQPRLDAELIELIRRMASNNHTWGCERIRGERLKLGCRVGKRTIQRYVRGIRPDVVAIGGGATVIRIPPSAPNCNAICERFLGSVRRECLNHILILSEDHPRRALRAFCAHFSMGRPHQDIGQRVPADNKRPRLRGQAESAGAVVEFPVLGGLHHEYRMAA